MAGANMRAREIMEIDQVRHHNTQNYAMQGRSAAHKLVDPASIENVRDSLAMETYGNKAIWENDWKLLWSWEQKRWELFNLQLDPGEINDLSTVHPARVENMIQTPVYQSDGT